MLRSGCAGQLLPDSVPLRSTVYGWFLRLRDECVLERANDHLVMLDRSGADWTRRQPLGRGGRQPERQAYGGWRAKGLRRWQEDQHSIMKNRSVGFGSLSQSRSKLPRLWPERRHDVYPAAGRRREPEVAHLFVHQLKALLAMVSQSDGCM